MRPGTGELVAVYGGNDFLKNQLNWATLRARPGSSFKPFAVAAALSEPDKFNIYSTFQGDSPIEIQGLKLKNEFNKDFGDVTLQEATEQSINTAFYDLIDNQLEDGPEKLVEAAEKAGIPKTTALERGRNNPSTVLGPDPYSPLIHRDGTHDLQAAIGRSTHYRRRAHAEFLHHAGIDLDRVRRSLVRILRHELHVHERRLARLIEMHVGPHRVVPIKDAAPAGGTRVRIPFGRVRSSEVAHAPAGCDYCKDDGGEKRNPVALHDYMEIGRASCRERV